MRWQKTVDHNSTRLLLIFSGWATNAETLKNVSLAGYDTIVVWNYTSDDLPIDILTPYSEIILVGWSFGVFMAGRFLHNNPGLPITLRVAVNGTLHPVHEKFGIPKRIFSLTLRHLNKESISQFWERMCGEGPKHLPADRPEEELKAELERIAWLYEHEGEPKAVFDKAFIADNDKIIPTRNQTNAWETTDCFIISGAHFPDFNAIISSLPVNKDRVQQRFSAVQGTYHDNAVAQQAIADRLVAMTPPDIPVDNVLEIGCGTGMLTTAFINRFSGIKQLVLTDLRPISKFNFKVELICKQCDAEALLYTLPPDSFSTIISSSTIQWFNSQIGFFKNLERVLQPGGYALISTFGPLTFQQLYGLAPRLELQTLSGIKSIIPEGLKIVEAYEERIDLEFDTPMDVLRHFHLTGVNSIDGKASAFSMLRHYPRDAEGRCRLTYHPLYLILKKP